MRVSRNNRGKCERTFSLTYFTSTWSMDCWTDNTICAFTDDIKYLILSAYEQTMSLWNMIEKSTLNDSLEPSLSSLGDVAVNVHGVTWQVIFGKCREGLVSFFFKSVINDWLMINVSTTWPPLQATAATTTSTPTVAMMTTLAQVFFFISFFIYSTNKDLHRLRVRTTTTTTTDSNNHNEGDRRQQLPPFPCSPRPCPLPRLKCELEGLLPLFLLPPHAAVTTKTSPNDGYSSFGP